MVWSGVEDHSSRGDGPGLVIGTLPTFMVTKIEAWLENGQGCEKGREFCCGLGLLLHHHGSSATFGGAKKKLDEELVELCVVKRSDL